MRTATNFEADGSGTSDPGIWGSNASALVTGAAGFIGSALSRRLVDEGLKVRGVDCFDSYYSRRIKEANLEELGGAENFDFRDHDLVDGIAPDLLEGVTYVFHTAAQAGVRGSWSDGFDHYVRNNIRLTQQLLEALKGGPVCKFVYSSSSSVYGDVPQPVNEQSPNEPRSPYGVTKFAAEHLCGVYAREFDVPTISLRYFTVYGPAQRPDMAFHRAIEAALNATEFPLYGDGSARRDFTYIDDVVEANVLAARRTTPGGLVVNVGGGDSWSLGDVLLEVERSTGRSVARSPEGRQAGDVKETSAVTDAARDYLGWSPQIGLKEGLERQIAWHRERRDILDAA